MNGLSPSISAVFDRWRAAWQSVRIARMIYPVLWENVRRKIPGARGTTDLTEYAQVRAAQLVQEHVDIMMQSDPALSGAFATQLLNRSTDRAVKLVSEAAANACRVERKP